MKTVDETTLENLLYLSRLSPESTDMATLKKQVDEIVGYFEILSKYDDSENPYDAYPSTEAEKLREDTVVPGLQIPDVKNITDKFMDGYFQVPKVLGEGAQFFGGSLPLRQVGLLQVPLSLHSKKRFHHFLERRGRLSYP